MQLARSRMLFSWLVAASMAVAHGSASAQHEPDEEDSPQALWQQSWPRFHPAEYAATGSLIVGAVVIAETTPSTDVRWSEPNSFDDGVRRELRLSSAQGRQDAATASDVLMVATMAYPYLAANVAWLAHDDPDAAWQMAMINTQSFALSAAVVSAIKAVSGRARPYLRECEASADPTDCAGDNFATSFLSGHTAMAFTGAGLTCAHHLNLPLFGGGAADTLTCVAALGAATTTGYLRIAADKHYLTDVLAGAAVGALSGWLLPTLLHYGLGGGEDESSDVALSPALGSGAGRHEASAPVLRAQLTPWAGPSQLGLAVTGLF